MRRSCSRGYLNNNVKGAKIGVVYQNDAYGIPYLAALKRYLGKNNKIVDAEPYDAHSRRLDRRDAAGREAASQGAQTALYIMALPLQSVSALVTANKIGWKPKATS